MTKRRTVNILFKLLFFACCRTGLNKIKTRPSKLVIKNRGNWPTFFQNKSILIKNNLNLVEEKFFCFPMIRLSFNNL